MEHAYGFMPSSPSAGLLRQMLSQQVAERYRAPDADARNRDFVVVDAEQTARIVPYRVKTRDRLSALVQALRIGIRNQTGSTYPPLQPPFSEHRTEVPRFLS